MNTLSVRNWEKFQGYKRRGPPWIKLHVGLLENYEFYELPERLGLVVILLWLLASRTDNQFPDDADWLSQAIHLPLEDADIEALVGAKWLLRQHNDAGVARPAKTKTTQTPQDIHDDNRYAIWVGMNQRCHNPKAAGYPNYGGRGIAVCPQWRDDFHAFTADVGPRPSPEHSLDRTDNDGNYEPGNVEWVLARQQIANRRPGAATLESDVSRIPRQNRSPETETETEQSQNTNATHSAAPADENLGREFLPAIREHLWSPDKKPGRETSEAREVTMVRELLTRNLTKATLRVLIEGLGFLRRGLCDPERRVEWLEGQKGSLKVLFGARSGHYAVRDLAEQAYWWNQGKRQGKPQNPVRLEIPNVRSIG